MAKKKETPPASSAVTVLEPEVVSEELQVVQSDWQTLVAVMGERLAPFFNHATALTTVAQGVLADAKALVLPVDDEADAACLTVVRRGNQAKKALVLHWDGADNNGPTKLLSRLHRALTAKRGEGEKIADEASNIAQRLHNRYDSEKKQKIAEENDRIRREAEAKERQRIADQAADLARQAEEAEANAPTLSAKEALFVQKTVEQGMSAERAAKECGYADPFKSVPRLFASTKIQQAIRAAQEAKHLRQQAEAAAQQPVIVDVEMKEATTVSLPGGFDTTRYSAELLDESRLIRAILDGGYGIPTDILRVDQARLNYHARESREQINRWPGVRLKSETKSR